MKRAVSVSAPPPEEDRYRLLVDAITDYAIYMLDPDGVVTSWNAGAHRFKGYEAHEIIGQHFSRFYTDADRLADRPAIALETAEREGRFEGEGWRVRKDGSRFWANVVIDPIRTPSGELLGFAKITRDLTERKLAEESLRLSEEQFRLLVQGVSDYAIYMLDATGHVSNWNPGAQRIKGYTPEEIIGRHFSAFYTEDDREAGEPQRALETAEREGRFEKEAIRVRKDGTRFWANVVIDPIRDATNRVIGFAKITRDVTERKATQRALDEAREQLFQAQKLEAIGQLTGGIAHDFNNLLMVVLGSLELMRKRLPGDSSLMPLLENAVQGAQRGASLTRRMLAFARRQNLDPQPTGVQALVADMNDLMQRSLGPAFSIDTTFPNRLPPAMTDANQLEAALLNLVVNARDAMPQGGAIAITGREETVAEDGALKPGRYVVIAVTDNGEGMDPETLARASDPFFTTKGVGKGTGLGLSMVQGLAEQSGGRLVLTSRMGEGTTAELWFPVAAEGAPAADRATAAPEPLADGRHLSVLAVDDDPLVLNNTAAMLADLGHTVFEADSAAEALDILKEYRIELVLTDHAMPQMTGAQLAAMVNARWPAVPIILATGFAELPPGTGAGLPRLAKPFTQDELARAIAEASPVS
ncbi:PAS domain S-box protein [Emcibacter sp. SYSU 3D8]|uniref:hybrid sensor histidine kinase/response regulator n=1 Tax=Emcibacter sp. SYSU 3D8 TaxID=3133969 RepID=UPI0031FECC47